MKDTIKPGPCQLFCRQTSVVLPYRLAAAEAVGQAYGESLALSCGAVVKFIAFECGIFEPCARVAVEHAEEAAIAQRSFKRIVFQPVFAYAYCRPLHSGLC